MSKSGHEEDELFKNVQSLRRRLQATEDNLLSLDGYGGGKSRQGGPLFSTPEKASHLRREAMDESREIQQLLSADGSYQAVERSRPLHSQADERLNVRTDTFSSQQLTRKQNTSQQQLMTSQTLVTSQQQSLTSQQKSIFRKSHDLELRPKQYRSLDSSQSSKADIQDISMTSREGDSRKVNFPVGTEPFFGRPQQQSRGGTMRHSPVDMALTSDPAEELRRKLQKTRDESAQLLRHNHALLNQLEDVTYQHHKLQQQHEAVGRQLGEKQTTVEEMQERVVCLQSENDTHEKALREAEDRNEDLQREVASGDTVLKEYQAEIHDLKAELADSQTLLQRVEQERDKTLKTAEELHSQFESYQRKTKDTIHKSGSKEEEYLAKLQHVSEEREVLLQNAESSQQALASLQRQLREWQDELRIEKESRADAEQHNSQLRSQVADLQHQAVRLDNAVRSGEGLQRENDALRAVTQDYQHQLQHCQLTIGESQAELARLEKLARKRQSGSQQKSKDDSASKDLNGSYLQALDANVEKASDTIKQLRGEVESKSAEIQGLRDLLERQRASQHGAQTSNKTHSDTQNTHTMRERQLKAESRVEELEALLLRQEEERSKHLAEVHSLQEQINDLDIEVKGHESKLKHRSDQVCDLQRELSEKVNQVSALEREVRKKASQIDSIERQLDDKVTELADHASATADLERDLTNKAAHIAQLKKEVEEKAGSLLQQKAMADRMKAMHVQQCSQLDTQMQQLEKRFQEKDELIKELRGNIQALQTKLTERDDEIHRTNTLAKQEISRKIRENETVLKQWEDTAKDATSKVQKLESALLMCKEELNVYLDQYEQTKYSHSLELAAREKQVEEAERERATQRATVVEREKQIVELERSLDEHLQMLQQNNKRLAELEDGNGGLQQQVCELEQELQTERGRVQEARFAMEGEIRSIETKLHKACADIEQGNVRMRELSATISSLEAEKRHLADEAAELEAQLSQERVDAENKMAAIGEKEKQISALKTQLKNSQEQVAETEEKVNVAKNNWQQKAEEMSALQSDHTTLQMEYQARSNQLAEVQLELDSVSGELEDRNKLLEQHKHTIRRKEDDSKSKTQELEAMERELEQRDWQIQQRAAELTQLEMAVKENKADFEHKVIRLEGQLQKTQLEAQQRHKQVSDLETRLNQAHAEIQDKCLKLQQNEQTSRKVRLENEDKSSQLHELETQMYVLRHRLETCINENSEVAGELKTAREETRKIHGELTESRRELAVSKRDQEKWRSEYQALLNQYQDAEVELKSAKEQLGLSRVQGAELESRAGNEMRKLISEVDAMRTRHQNEMKEMDEKMITQKENEERFREKIRELEKAEEHVNLELDESQKHGSNQRAQLQAAQMLITELQGKLALKESEIARLQGRLHGLERSSVTSHRSYEMTHTPSVSQIQHAPVAGQTQNPPSEQTAANGSLRSNMSGAPGSVPDSLIFKDGQRSSVGDSYRHTSDGPCNMAPSLDKFASSKDDSIVSLLDRMCVHEAHVQEVLQERMSLEPRPGSSPPRPEPRPPHIDALIVPKVPPLKDTRREGHNTSDYNPFRLFQGEDSLIGASLPVSSSQFPTMPPSLVLTSGSHTITPDIPSAHGHQLLFQSEQRNVSDLSTGPLSDSHQESRGLHSQINKPPDSMDPLESSASDLATALAKDPASFQAMFQRLKDSYISASQNANNSETRSRPDSERGRENSTISDPTNRQGPDSLMNVMKELNTMSESVDTASWIANSFIPTLLQKETRPNTNVEQFRQTDVLESRRHVTHPTSLASRDVDTLSDVASTNDSTISVITESESLGGRRGLESSDVSSKHYTSSPKVTTKTKSVFTAKPSKLTKTHTSNDRGGFSKGTKSSVSKVVKKGTITRTSFFGGTKKAVKSSVTGKKSASGTRMQNGSVKQGESKKTDIATTAKSPGEQSHSPNVSTAIAHYAAELSQSEVSAVTGPAHNLSMKGEDDLDAEKCLALLKERRRALEARKHDLHSQIMAAEKDLSHQSIPGSKK